MKYVDYTIGDKRINNYEKIFRVTSKEGVVDGVDILPIIRYKNKQPEVVMIVELRPPVQAYTLAFPTGMTHS